MLTAAVTVTFDSSSTKEVTLSAIEGNNSIILLDESGKADIGSITAGGNVTLGNNPTVFRGTVGDITSNGTVTVGNSNTSYYFQGKVTGNITGTTVNIYNKGTIGSESEENQSENRTTITATTGNISITNGVNAQDNTGAKIYSDIFNGENASGTISVTNNAGATFTGNITNSSKEGTTTVTNRGNAMAGAITSDSTGALTLSGATTATEKMFTGSISTKGSLFITGSIGPNDENSAINVTLTDGVTINGGGNIVFYLTVTGSDIKTLTVVSSTTKLSGSTRNTIDLSGLENVSVTQAIGEGTELKLAEGNTPNTSWGTAITTPVSTSVPTDGGNAYFTGGTLTVGSSENTNATVCKDGTLTLTSQNVIIYNYGEIGTINHTGNGTLTIYNMVEGATIGNVTSNGSVTITLNEGKIGNVEAANAITVGASNKKSEDTVNANGTNVHPGNSGAIGDLTAQNAVTIYRNAGEKASIGAVESKTASVAIGQNNAVYGEYNTNNGSIGSVTARTTVGIYGTGEGTVAKEDSESIAAGTNVTIGITAQQNQNKVGEIKADGSVTIYSSGEVDKADAMGGVTIGGTGMPNAAKIGEVTAVSNITIHNGSNGDVGAVTSSAGTINIGNATKLSEGKIGKVTATASSVTVYGAAGSEVASITAGTTVTIGSTAAPNQGKIGAVESTGGEVKVYGGENGSVESIKAATSVTIGGFSNKTAYYNQSEIGKVTAGVTISIYNGEKGKIGEEAGVTNTGGNIVIRANQGTVGAVETKNGSITVGDSNNTAAKAESTNGIIGNAGTLGDLTASGAVNIYRNTESATIGSVTSGTSVTVGNYSTDTDVTAFNANSGTIGSIAAGTTVTLYNNTATGKIAAGEGESVTAKTGITVGNREAMQNAGTIGSMTTQSGTVSVSNSGTIGTITNEGTGTNTLYIYDGATSTSLTAAGGAVTIYDNTTQSNAPNINITTDGGSVTVNPNTGANVSVHVTVTSELGENETMSIRGGFATVIHNGAGDVVMETADTSVTNIMERSTGQVLQFGETGTVVETPTEGSYTLSLVQTGPNTVDVYLLSVDGTALEADAKVTDLKVTTENGTVTSETATVVGGGASEKIGTVTLTGSGEVTVSGTYQIGTENVAVSATLNAEIPALIDRVDTVLLTSEEDFEAAKATYGWDNSVEAPDTDSYPVLAVMPVINEAYEGVEVEVKVGENGENEVTGSVSFVSVDVSNNQVGQELTVSVSASTSGVPNYSDDATYTLTAADLAKLDTETKYYYVTYRHMDGATADKVVPVEQGESLTLENPNSRTGYTFLGWSDGTTTYTANTAYTPETDATLTAQWGATQVTHTLTLNVSGSGKVVNNATGAELTSGTSFLDGTVITLRAEPYAGHYFQSWSVDGTTSSESTVTITMDKDVTVTANFGRNSTSSGGSTYSVSTGSAEHGSIAVSPKNAAKGKTVTITVTPDEGYELASLTVTDAKGNAISLTEQGGGKYTFTMPASGVTVLAAFREIPQTHICPSEPYTDVDTSLWYHAAIDYAIENGMMNGVGEGRFAPTGLLSRGMMVTILYRLEGEPTVSGASFADVASGLWYTDAVAWAAANGIVDGYGNGNFGPEDNITREQMAAILYRYASFKGYDVSARGSLSSFADGDRTSGWARETMQWAVGAGLINGKGNATLDPTGTAQRSEVAQILMNFCENIAEK